MATPKVLITGAGAICAAGKHPDEITSALVEQRSGLRPIAQWDTTDWPRKMGGEIPDFDPVALLKDRKIQKFIRRSDVLGLYAAERAIEMSGFVEHRAGMDEAAAAIYSDRSGLYVGSGGGSYASQYDYFPPLDLADGSLEVFGREMGATVNPMWLLRTLPNNVLGHVGIRQNLKGPNACITNHGVSGMVAVIEAMQALRHGEADRTVAIGHDAPVEPQTILYCHQIGLLAEEMIRPFDVDRDGSVFGEGAAALVLETEASAAARGATVLGEVLGGAASTDPEGLFALREDGGGLADAIRNALDDARIKPSDVGMIVAHANGTQQSDASEAAALLSVFGASPPPITGFKWAFGHLIAAAGIIEAVQALWVLRVGAVPGIATLRKLDPAFPSLPVSAERRKPRGNIALILSRGFGGTNAALLLRSVP